MIKTAVRIILRQLLLNKTYSVINILGLAIGIAGSLVIYKIIVYESGFDNYHSNAKNIYRVVTKADHPQRGTQYWESQVHPIGAAIRNDFPNVETAMTYFATRSQITVRSSDGEDSRYQLKKGLAYAEPQLFTIFDFDFLAGDPEKALNEDGSVVLTSSLAQKYFNLMPSDVATSLGKTIIINNHTVFTVKGVISDLPANTDLPFEIIANYRGQSASNPYYRGGIDWKEFSSRTNCYLLLPDNISPEIFEEQLISFYDKYHVENRNQPERYLLQPLSELHSGYCNNYNKRLVSTNNLLVLGLIGLFLLLIASFNFINLSTAQATKRYKQVGVRKVFGESKTQLISLQLVETVIMSFFATIAGLVIAIYSFKYLKNIIGYSLSIDLINNPGTIVYLFLIAIVIGLFSGLYPAINISKLNPAYALKNISSDKKLTGTLAIRRTLVTTQFVISIVLIISTLVMYKQMNYFRDKELGFNNESILLSTLPGGAKADKLQLLKEKLLKIPAIEKVSFATKSPMSDWKVNNAIVHSAIEKDAYYGSLKNADEDYLDLFGLKLIAGNNFSKVKNNGDAVVNRKLTSILGFENPNDAIGESFGYGAELEFKIVGVVEDFHARSLQREMDNVVFSNYAFNIMEMALKINSSSIVDTGYNEVIKEVQGAWNSVFPDFVFNYSFFDEQINNSYSEENHTTRLIQIFAIIAILIGCLGLYGLISYVNNQKTKEIGIRRVNGASISGIMFLLNKDFLKWLSFAFVIACPIAYWAMSSWLNNFAYRTSLSIWIFIIAGIMVIIITLITVSWQTYKAARKNPVTSLRYE
jgi:putative ABC transport system permease protein